MLSPLLTTQLADAMLTMLSPHPAPIQLVADDLSADAGQPLTKREIIALTKHLNKQGHDVRTMHHRVNGRLLYVPRESFARFLTAANRAAESAT